MKKKTIEFIESLLELGEKDIYSSEILYHNKLYPQSIYLLTQAFEKIAKAHYLLEGDINLDDLQKISHKTYQGAFLGMQRLNEKNPDILDNNLKQDVKDYLSKKALTKTRKSLHFEKDTIIKMIEDYPCRKNQITFKDFFDQAIPLKKKLKKEIALDPLILLLGFIIAPHSEVLRYPNEIKSPISYNESTGIVQAFEFLSLRVVEILVLIKEKTKKLKKNLK